jgi:phosphomannomutase/phosphoglucomutase
MNKEIFREYDIRGVVDIDLNEDIVRNIGKAYATEMIKNGFKKIAIARDCRLSSRAYRDALIEGTQSSGLDVIDLGVCPTPVLYFGIRHLKTDGGIMITGSHNPPEFNGFKICIGNDTIFGGQIQNLYRIIQTNFFIQNSKPGSFEYFNILDTYLKYLHNNIKID